MFNEDNPSINIDFYDGYYSAQWSTDISPLEFLRIVNKLINYDNIRVEYEDKVDIFGSVNQVELDYGDVNFIRVDSDGGSFTLEMGELRSEKTIGYMSSKDNISDLYSVYKEFLSH